MFFALKSVLCQNMFYVFDVLCQTHAKNSSPGGNVNFLNDEKMHESLTNVFQEFDAQKTFFSKFHLEIIHKWRHMTKG